MQLRPYQQKLIGQFYNALSNNNRAVCCQLATGGGKTPVAAQIVKDATLAGVPSLYLAHREELLSQATNKLQEFGVTPGMIKSGYDEDRSKLCQLASYQSLANRQMPPAGLIVFDECHLNIDAQLFISNQYPRAKILGLSATPYRLDGTGLKCVYNALITGPSVKWLIKNGFLPPYRAYVSDKKIDTSKVRILGGDYSVSGLTKAADKPSLRADAIKMWRNHAYNKRTLVFAASVAHSKHIADQYNRAGIAAEHIDGTTNLDERREAFERLRTGKTLILCNYEIATTGTDIPAVECVQLLRPTKSLQLALQMMGRAFRMFDGKKYAIILDHAGIIREFGYPDDDREWSLDGNAPLEPKRFKRCKRCQAVMPISNKSCPVCQYQYEQNPRSFIPLIDQTDLVEDWNPDQDLFDGDWNWDSGNELDSKRIWTPDDVLSEIAATIRARLEGSGVAESVIDRAVVAAVEASRKELEPEVVKVSRGVCFEL